MEPTTDRKAADRWTLVGNALLWLGVAVWGVYAVVRYGLGGDVSTKQFLPFHLAGVVPGLLLRRRRSIGRGLERLFRPGRDR